MSLLRKVKSLVSTTNQPSRDYYHDDVSEAYLKVQRREIAAALPRSGELKSGYDFSW